MIEIVIVATSTEKFQTIVDELESTPKVHTGWAKTSVEAIELASTSTPGLMIIDAQIGDPA